MSSVAHRFLHSPVVSDAGIIKTIESTKGNYNIGVGFGKLLAVSTWTLVTEEVVEGACRALWL